MKIDLSEGWTKTEVKYLIHGVTGIYCFCLQDEVMYVGKAIDIKNRLLNHSKSDPDFDVYILESDYKKLSNVETMMISKYNPSGNIIGASQSPNPVVAKGVGLRLKEWQHLERIAYENRMTVNGVAVKIIRDFLTRPTSRAVDTATPSDNAAALHK